MQNDSNIPEGYCQCGCGGKTNLARQTHRRYGWVKNKPLKYIVNHHRRGAGIKSNFEKAYVIDEKTGCWNWQHYVGRSGYGSVTISGRTLAAHRYSYERYKGPIQKGTSLDHLCRNRACVNPEHLEPVIAAVNTQRGKGTKLSKTQVVEIRKLASTGKYTQAEIARLFSVSRSNVGLIANRQTWINI
jgi:hypothetical protein